MHTPIRSVLLLLAVGAWCATTGCSSMDGPHPATSAREAEAGSSSAASSDNAAETPAAAVGATAPAAEASAPAKVGASAQTLEPYFQSGLAAQARRHFDARRYDEAAKAFGSVARQAGPESAAAAYMAGISHHYAGQHDAAVRVFQSREKEGEPYADYHRYFAAEAFLEAGKPEQAHQWAAKVGKKGGNAERASKLMAEALFEAKRYAEATRQIEKHREAYGAEGPLDVLYGDCLAAQKNQEAAARAYRQVTSQYPGSGSAGKAEAKLDKLLGSVGGKNAEKWSRLTASERLGKGRALYEAHRSKTAAKLLAQSAKDFAKGSNERCEALYLAGRSYAKLRKRDLAAPFYDEARSECGKTRYMDDILYFGGKAAYRQGKNSRALDYFEALHQSHPKVSYNDDALIWEAHIYAERKAPKKRNKALNTALTKYPDGDMNHEAAWLLVWDAFKAKRYRDAVAAADRALSSGRDSHHEYARGRLRYWRARALSRLGDKAAAQKGYESVLRATPLTWYAGLAYTRLAESQGQQDADARLSALIAGIDPLEQPLPKHGDPLYEHPALRRGIEMIRLGFGEPARREFKVFRADTDARADWLTASMYAAANATGRSYRIARRLSGQYVDQWPANGWQERWALGFPRPYEDDVSKFAKAAGAPLDLAWAVMRIESAFDPKIESYANAIGLMQLLEGTAKGVADPGEKSRIDGQALRQPETNIRLGTRYLGRLYNRFGNQAPLAAAGYNAGSAPVKKWLASRGHLPLDEFVDTIPYRQTRRYVKSVTGGYFAYHFLRTGALPKLDLTSKMSALVR